MPELTIQQIRLLTWLSLADSSFEVCLQKGIASGQYNGLQTYFDDKGNYFKFDIRSLNKLLKEELVFSQTVDYFHTKWNSYVLTEKGQVFVSLMSATKDMSWPQLRKHQ